MADHKPTPSRVVDITGQRFGRLVAVRHVGSHNGNTMWECRCDCGSICQAQGAGLQRAFKPVKDVADRAGEVWVAAEVKLAVELDRQGPAKGAAGPGRGKAGSKAGPAFTDAPTLAELGVAKKRAARAKKLAALPKRQKAKIIKTLKARESRMTMPGGSPRRRHHIAAWTMRDRRPSRNPRKPPKSTEAVAQGADRLAIFGRRLRR
jgi:hypothetical protein